MAQLWEVLIIFLKKNFNYREEMDFLDHQDLLGKKEIEEMTG